MQVKGRRTNHGLAEHHVNLPAVVSLVIEKMAYRDRCFLCIIFILIVLIAKGSLQKFRLQPIKKAFDFYVKGDSGLPQLVKFGKQNAIERRRFVPGALETGHPDLVTEQEVIQKAMDAAEGTMPLLPVLRGSEVTAFVK